MPSRFAVVPRRGDATDVRWFEAEPTYVLHWINAYEDGDEIVLDGYFQDDPEPPPAGGTLYQRMSGSSTASCCRRSCTAGAST